MTAAPARRLNTVDLLLRKQALAGAENPAQLQAHAGALFGVRLDLDRPLALDQVRRVVVELGDEIPAPDRQRGAQELRDLLQQVEDVDVRFLLVMKMRLAGVGREADQLAALARTDVRRRGALAVSGAVAVPGAIAVPVAIPVAVGIAQRGGAGRVRIHPKRLESQAFGPGVENEDQRTRSPVGFAVAGGAVAGGRSGGLGRGRQSAGQGRHLVGHQFFNFVQAGHRDGPRQFGIRGGGTHGKAVRAPVDHGVLLLLFDLAVDDRVLVRQLDLPDLAVAIHAAALFQLGDAEISRPFMLQFPEPKLEGLRSVDAFGSVPLHRAKRLSVETVRRSATPNSRFRSPRAVMDLPQLSPCRHPDVTRPRHAGGERKITTAPTCEARHRHRDLPARNQRRRHDLRCHRPGARPPGPRGDGLPPLAPRSGGRGGPSGISRSAPARTAHPRLSAAPASGCRPGGG